MLIETAVSMWGSYKQLDGSVHCIPYYDLHEHYPTNCACHPRQDDECENLFIHNSFDGREDFETGRRKVS